MHTSATSAWGHFGEVRGSAGSFRRGAENQGSTSVCCAAMAGVSSLSARARARRFARALRRTWSRRVPQYHSPESKQGPTSVHDAALASCWFEVQHVCTSMTHSVAAAKPLTR